MPLENINKINRYEDSRYIGKLKLKIKMKEAVIKRINDAITAINEADNFADYFVNLQLLEDYIKYLKELA